MQRSSCLALAALFFACGPQEPTAPSPQAVAHWQGGELVLEELEEAFPEARTSACREARNNGGIDDLLSCYRELTRELALERLLLQDIEDIDQAIEGLEGYEALRQHAWVETFRSRLRGSVEITEGEVENRFASDRSRYQRPGLLTLHNIFRRHEIPDQPEATVAYLEDLRRRFEAGETWAELARLHSQSETRLRGGLVGDIREGRLPGPLEEIAFSLPPGGVSEPIKVRGGAVLLHVTRKAERVDFTLDEARQRIERELRGEKIRTAHEALLGDREPPADALILELTELIAALDSGDDARVVLDIAGHQRTVGEIRLLAGLGPGETAGSLDTTQREGLERLYRRQQDQPLLFLALLKTDDPELRRQAEEHLRREGLSLLADERIAADLQQDLSDEPEAVRRYFEDNQHHYQSPLRFKLRLWNLPFDDDPPSLMVRLEAARERLARGELELEAAAAELGGAVRDLGWQSFEQLPGLLPPKARDHFIHLAEGGYSIAYQQHQALHVIHVAERDEPRPMTYAEAEDQVRQDYLRRFEQELYQALAAERLEQAGFVYDEAAVRRQLIPAEDVASAESS
ncbi:MAG: peptidylprolyl isomerase [Acidobacteriota bacterium]